MMLQVNKPSLSPEIEQYQPELEALFLQRKKKELPNRFYQYLQAHMETCYNPEFWKLIVDTLIEAAIHNRIALVTPYNQYLHITLAELQPSLDFDTYQEITHIISAVTDFEKEQIEYHKSVNLSKLDYIYLATFLLFVARVLFKAYKAFRL